MQSQDHLQAHITRDPWVAPRAHGDAPDHHRGGTRLIQPPLQGLDRAEELLEPACILEGKCRYIASGALTPNNPNVRANTCFAAVTSFSRALLMASSPGSVDTTRHWV